jgi:hypothetical protein
LPGFSFFLFFLASLVKPQGKREAERNPLLTLDRAMEEPHSPPPRAATAEEGYTTLLDLDVETLRLVRGERTRKGGKTRS